MIVKGERRAGFAARPAPAANGCPTGQHKVLWSPMSYQWLQMRISEEKDRRAREAMVLERLPRAMQEMYDSLAVCVAAYQEAFGPEAADMQLVDSSIHITVRDAQGKVDLIPVPEVPGFRVEREGPPMIVEIGLLPGDKVYYRDCEQDQF